MEMFAAFRSGPIENNRALRTDLFKLSEIQRLNEL